MELEALLVGGDEYVELVEEAGQAEPTECGSPRLAEPDGRFPAQWLISACHLE
jgi:hypothetical protein